MGTIFRQAPTEAIAATITALNGEPSGVAAGSVYCDGFSHVSVVCKVTANATDTSGFSVWFGYPSTAKSVSPPTVEWVRDTRSGTAGTTTVTQGTNGSTEGVFLEVPAGAVLVYPEWEARTDADTRITVRIHLDRR